MLSTAAEVPTPLFPLFIEVIFEEKLTPLPAPPTDDYYLYPGGPPPLVPPIPVT
jgi:hypothetical protein